MKKVIAVVLAIMTVFTINAFAKTMKGDVDGDGKITAGDARLALRQSVGLKNLTDDKFNNADYDGDGKVTAADARCILRVSIGLAPYDNNDEPTTKKDEPTTKMDEPTTKKDEPATDKDTGKKIDHYTVDGWSVPTLEDIWEGAKYYIVYTDGTKEGPKTKPYSPGNEPKPIDLTHCQHCGKETGYDGYHYFCAYGGCSCWLLDLNCPECGKFVPAGTCHTCKHTISKPTTPYKGK